MTSIIDHNPRNPFGIVGTALADVSDAKQALRLAGLDYTIELAQAEASVIVPDGVTQMKAPHTYLTVKRNADGSAKILKGSHGSQYAVIQNSFTTDLLQQVVADTGATFGAMGYTHDGARTFAQILLPEGITVGGRDPINFSLLGLNTHDGSGKFTLAPLGTRLFCTNQFPGIKRTETKFTLAHSKRALSFKLEDVRHAIDLAGVYIQETAAIGNKLVEAKMTSKEFLSFVDVISPKSIDAKTKEETFGSQDRRAWLEDTFNHAENLDNIRNTRWAAAQTWIEYLDFAKPAKGANGAATRTILRTDDKQKLDALDLLLAGV